MEADDAEEGWWWTLDAYVWLNTIADRDDLREQVVAINPQSPDYAPDGVSRLYSNRSIGPLLHFQQVLLFPALSPK